MSIKKIVKGKVDKDKVVKEISELSDVLLGKFKQAKSKYDKMDSADKKKLWAVVAGATALLAGIGAARKHECRKGKK